MPDTVLIVDDDRAIAKLTAMRVSASGYRAITAFNGRSGLEAVAMHLPRLILLDIRMPDMDGFEFHRQLKENAQHAGTPVVFVSANAQEAARRQAFVSGARFFLAKPYEPAELIRAIRDALAEGAETNCKSP